MADEQVYEIDFNPNPVQQRFIESRAMADLFSSRMGEGKSAGLVWANFYHTRHNPGARWAFIRDTWENLRDTTQKEFFKWFPPGIFGTYTASAKTWTWAVDGFGNGEIMWLGMDDPQDAAKLQSRELAGFAMDEPAPAQGSAGIDELVFTMAMSRLRMPGMKWYAAKLAQNNSDESHWTYRQFVNPGTDGYVTHQPIVPENVANLPVGYYEKLKIVWRDRPDLLRRFVEGKFGYQQEGKAVTPEWNDDLHLTLGLSPYKGRELILLWDGGLQPVCIITQISPMGHWHVLEAYYGEEVGIFELIRDVVKPVLHRNYRNFSLLHIGDPALQEREQSSVQQSAVKVIKRELGGIWRPGPVATHERVDPLRAVLTRTTSGRGVVQVDRLKAAPVWHALRGGWHHHVARTGIVSGEPKKNHPHSDIGDAMGYGAAVLFPYGQQKRPKPEAPRRAQQAGYGWSRSAGGILQPPPPSVILPGK